jgi:ProP effector
MTVIDARPIIDMLCQKFPAAFVMFEQRRKPLALGIHREILAAMPMLAAEQIGAAMRLYVANEFYCRECREGAARINLMGHEAGCVTAAEADSARARIEGMREWKKKRKAAAKTVAKRAKAEVAAKAEVESVAAAKVAGIEAGNAAAPTSNNPNFSKPKLQLGSMRKAS